MISKKLRAGKLRETLIQAFRLASGEIKFPIWVFILVSKSNPTMNRNCVNFGELKRKVNFFGFLGSGYKLADISARANQFLKQKEKIVGKTKEIQEKRLITKAKRNAGKTESTNR